jgi:hypothetical protein
MIVPIYFFPTPLMVEVQKVSTVEIGEIHPNLQSSLAFLTENNINPHFLGGLTGASTLKHIEGRMRELPFPKSFPLLAKMVGDPLLRVPALETLRHFAYDQSYSFRMDALRALAAVEDSAREHLAREERAIGNVSAPIRNQIIGTTMEQTAIS